LGQSFLVCLNYANDNADVLPSAADNSGQYHSIRLSDQTYTNLVNGYAAGNSNIFFCPNLCAADGVVIIPFHDAYGYIIGYSYLADNVVPSVKGSDPKELESIKLSSIAPTNELLADANYWTLAQNASIPVLQIAPHTPSGAATSEDSSTLSATNTAGIGAVGGNILFYDGSVNWRVIKLMKTYSASSESDAKANW
jgi:prepilin-type processing-associated H-X9-DG protein